MERTSRAQVIRSLRLMWLRSKERATALKREGYCCEVCKVKQSKKKGSEQRIEVHHKKGIGNWDEVVGVIMKEILCDPKELEVLCPDCHRIKEKYF